MKILQLNLNQCKAAHDLLMQTTREQKLDLALLAEPYKLLTGQLWEVDTASIADTWYCGKLPFQCTVTNDSVGFVSATINGTRFYSCYAPVTQQLCADL